MKVLGVEEKSMGTQTLGSGPGCIRVISYDPPVNLEAVLIIKSWKLRGLWSSHLPEGTEQNPGVCDDRAHVPMDIVPPPVLSAYVTFSYDDPFN